ncbi:hypothetical protein KC353_g21370, partial [Hortaea werneckii]
MSGSTPARQLPNGTPRLTNGNPSSNVESARRGASMTREGTNGAIGSGQSGVSERDGEEEAREDPVQAMLRERCAQTEAKIAALFGADGQVRRASKAPSPQQHGGARPAHPEEPAKTSVQPKKAARQIDDDYGDDDDDEEDEEHGKESPLKGKDNAGPPNGVSAHPVRSPGSTAKPTTDRNSSTTAEQAKSSEDVRKQLEEDKAMAAEAAKRNFQTMFFTLENDRDAMLEQQKLDELDREVE